ncbi:hypothetical protein AAHC03_025980 [Spirometra sp. Aus1]
MYLRHRLLTVYSPPSCLKHGPANKVVRTTCFCVPDCLTRHSVVYQPSQPFLVLPGWHQLPKMREKRDAPAAVALSDGRVFVFGGWNGEFCLASVEFCCLQADWSNTIETARTEDFWRPLAPMRAPRYAHAAVAFKGKIIVAGGLAVDEDDSHNEQSVVEIFSPPDAECPLGEWTRVVDLLVPRSYFSLLVYKGRLYALGDGNTIEKFAPEDPPATADDLSSWSWAELEPLNDLDSIDGAVVI